MRTTSLLLISSFFLAYVTSGFAQSPEKKQRIPIHAEIGLGASQTHFFGKTKATLRESYGGSFNPSVVSNLVTAFYFAPEKWKGLGLGVRIKGAFGFSVKGENGDSYIFNEYNVGLSAKYYPLKKEFNKSLYIRSGIGFGQFTSKRVNEEIKLYKHQYAIGLSVMGGIGYTFRAKQIGLSLEAEFDYSNRNGTIDWKGDANYQNGQIGASFIVSY